LREKADLETKIHSLTKDQEHLAADFTKYRAEITRKEAEKEQSIADL
jgi:hypothetical protein